MILDIAAGILVAALIVGIVVLGVWFAKDSSESGDHEMIGPSVWIVVVGLALGAALVTWRLFFHPAG